jgi:hypothetical protein
VDWDGDGQTDVLSGSCSGEVYLFRRREGTTFEVGKPLADSKGRTIQIKGLMGVFAVDWKAEGKLDLLAGTAKGEIYLIANEGDQKNPVFGEPQQLEAGGVPIQVESGFTSPIVADWNGDDKADLLTGAGDGSVVWYRNIGTAIQPVLAAAEVLVPKSTLPQTGENNSRPLACGRDARICVTDFNGDGRLDLLVGDTSSRFEGKPVQSEKERQQETQAIEELSQLLKAWAEQYQKYRELLLSPAGDSPAEKVSRDKKLKEAHDVLAKTKAKITTAQTIIEFYQSQNQTHGYVWLFMRKALPKEH